MGITQTSITSRIAFLGGTFDPIHLGHLHLAETAAAAFQCKVRLVVNSTPPHRSPPHANWAHRFSMCQQATTDNPHIIVGDEEAPTDDNAPHYTINTLTALKQQHQQVLLIMGMDGLLNFKSWHRWHDIFSLAHLIVAQRGGCAATIDEEFKPRLIDQAQLEKSEAGGIHLWDYQPPPIDATTIRQQLSAAQGEAAPALHPKTLAHIQKHGLYNSLRLGV